ncbi:MAG: mercury resistance system transport protein MerF [Proteobacteria bacterium]|nr:mercury resistance system transport protein MerF [Pseudomonadota bacterium]
MSPNKLICAGGTGSVIVAICCFTPVLVVLLGAVGLSAWLGWIDHVLFPALALFLGITAYGLWLRHRMAGCATGEPTNAKETGHG